MLNQNEQKGELIAEKAFRRALKRMFKEEKLSTVVGERVAMVLPTFTI